MDDTVLQTHRVNPRLVQVILLANGMQCCFLVIKLQRGDMLSDILYIIFTVYHIMLEHCRDCFVSTLMLTLQTKKDLEFKQGHPMHVNKSL